MSLLALQRDMRAWLTAQDAQAAGRIGRDARPGLLIYQNNYRAQLAACLEAIFDRTRAWMGREAFLAAASVHIERVPPSSWTLDAYGADFPQTLARLHPEDPEIAELAWIDLTLDQAFVTMDAEPLSPAALTGVDWDRAVLRLSPSLSLASQTTNAAAIWSALAARAPPPPVEAAAALGGLRVWRSRQGPRVRAIEADEARALERTRAGARFATICDDAVDRLGADEGVRRAGRWLESWLRDDLIVGVFPECSPCLAARCLDASQARTR